MQLVNRIRHKFEIVKLYVFIFPEIKYQSTQRAQAKFEHWPYSVHTKVGYLHEQFRDTFDPPAAQNPF